jgi:hypothetical protein
MPKGMRMSGGVDGQVSNSQIREKFFSFFDSLQSVYRFTDEELTSRLGIDNRSSSELCHSTVVAEL